MILLRENLEETLEEIGHEDLHIQLGVNGDIVLATTCGNTILMFPSLSPKASLSAAERKYLTRVIKTYIEGHVGLIADIVDAKAKLKDLTRPHYDKTSLSNDTVYYAYAKGVKLVSNSDDEYYIESKSTSTIEDVKSLLANLETVKGFILEVKDFKQELKRLQAIIALGTTCNV